MPSRLMALTLLAVLLAAAPVAAQSTRLAASWTATVGNEFRVVPNLTYLTANNWDATLDVYTPAAPGPHPTILHIHGGGWTGGSKESVVLRLMPYVEMGFAVVNVTYRLARVSEAPAAVEDCRCALRWVIGAAMTRRGSQIDTRARHHYRRGGRGAGRLVSMIFRPAALAAAN